MERKENEEEDEGDSLMSLTEDELKPSISNSSVALLFFSSVTNKKAEGELKFVDDEEEEPKSTPHQAQVESRQDNTAQNPLPDGDLVTQQTGVVSKTEAADRSPDTSSDSLCPSCGLCLNTSSNPTLNLASSCSCTNSSNSSSSSDPQEPTNTKFSQVSRSSSFFERIRDKFRKPEDSSSSSSSSVRSSSGSLSFGFFASPASSVASASQPYPTASAFTSSSSSSPPTSSSSSPSSSTSLDLLPPKANTALLQTSAGSLPGTLKHSSEDGEGVEWEIEQEIHNFEKNRKFTERKIKLMQEEKFSYVMHRLTSAWRISRSLLRFFEETARAEAKSSMRTMETRVYVSGKGEIGALRSCLNSLAGYMLVTADLHTQMFTVLTRNIIEKIDQLILKLQDTEKNFLTEGKNFLYEQELCREKVERSFRSFEVAWDRERGERDKEREGKSRTPVGVDPWLTGIQYHHIASDWLRKTKKNDRALEEMIETAEKLDSERIETLRTLCMEYLNTKKAAVTRTLEETENTIDIFRNMSRTLAISLSSSPSSSSSPESPASPLIYPTDSPTPPLTSYGSFSPASPASTASPASPVSAASLTSHVNSPRINRAIFVGSSSSTASDLFNANRSRSQSSPSYSPHSTTFNTTQQSSSSSSSSDLLSQHPHPHPHPHQNQQHSLTSLPTSVLARPTSSSTSFLSTLPASSHPSSSPSTYANSSPFPVATTGAAFAASSTTSPSAMGLSSESFDALQQAEADEMRRNESEVELEQTSLIDLLNVIASYSKMEVLKAGYCQKQNLFKQWKDYYMVLTKKGYLHIFPASESVFADESIAVVNPKVELISDPSQSPSNQFLFKLTTDDRMAGFWAAKKTFIFRTHSEPEMVDWILALKKKLIN